MSRDADGLLRDRGPATFPGAEQFDLTSAIAGRAYRIFVSRPGGEAPAGGFPVFMAVDGNMVFPIAAAVNATFALAGKAALVVGVGYPTDAPLELMSLRTRDLTPPTPLERLPQRPHLPPPKLEDYGGDEAFLRFLLEELMPLLAETYPIDQGDLTLYGHSFGGLFTVAALLRRPDAFRTFIASSPSLFWNRRAVFGQLGAFAATVRAGQASPRVLLMVGGAEESVPRPIPPMILEQVAERARWVPPLFRGVVAHWVVGRMLGEWRMIGNARRLAGRLRRLRAHAGGQVVFRRLAEDDHVTALPTSIGRAFAFALRA